MEKITDSEYTGWSEHIVSEWEEGILLLPMWYRSMYVPDELWIIYHALAKLNNSWEEPVVN